MLIQHIVDLLPESRQVHATGARGNREGHLRGAQESEDHGESVSMDDWLAGGQL